LEELWWSWETTIWSARKLKMLLEIITFHPKYVAKREGSFLAGILGCNKTALLDKAESLERLNGELQILRPDSYVVMGRGEAIWRTGTGFSTGGHPRVLFRVLWALQSGLLKEWLAIEKHDRLVRHSEKLRTMIWNLTNGNVPSDVRPLTIWSNLVVIFLVFVWLEAELG
jgi:hypothetical protein